MKETPVEMTARRVDEPDKPTVCCRVPGVWDPLHEGETCGGLTLRGAWVCPTCGSAMIGRKSKTVEAWRLTKGGRSIDTGRYRIRLDGSDKDTEAFMARLLKLPELEHRVLVLERELQDINRALERARKTP